MLLAIIVTFILVAAFGHTLGPERDGLILHRPYNNRYNDASGARDDHY